VSENWKWLEEIEKRADKGMRINGKFLNQLIACVKELRSIVEGHVDACGRGDHDKADLARCAKGTFPYFYGKSSEPSPEEDFPQELKEKICDSEDLFEKLYNYIDDEPEHVRRWMLEILATLHQRVSRLEKKK
jgi:hypothetical protein